MFDSWFDQRVSMREEDWLYIAYLVISWILSMGLGLLIGRLLTALI